MGVIAIVELLAFISSDETLGAFPDPTILTIAPDSDQKSATCCPPRNYHRAQVHASCIAFLADQIRSMSWDEFCAANRRNWDERVAIHRRDATGFYAIERFLAGDKRLHAIDIGELGEIAGKSVSL
jgi:hypothetical protein